MSKQTKNLIALAVLVVVTLISWRVNRIPETPQSAAAKQVAAAKAGSQEILQARFKRVRLEMDALYHYRSKPIPFAAEPSPFRLPPGMDTAAEVSSKASPGGPAKAVIVEPAVNAVLESGEGLLTHAISLMQFGGVVTFNNENEVAIDGRLHKLGDSFTVKVQTRLVLIRIKALTENSVTVALDDPEAGTASARVKLK